MRIAIILKTFPPDVIGGMETQTKQMATKLDENGHDITIITKKYGNHNDTDVPYRVIRVPNLRQTPVLSDATFLISALLIICRHRNEFDILQCMMIYPVGFLGYILNKLVGLPYFAWVRGGDFYLMKDVRWKRWMMRRVLKDTVVLVQSPDIGDDVQRCFNNIDCDIEVLANAVSIPQDTADGTNVLYVGRLAPKKGLKYLIKAMEDLDAELTIVGDGSEREHLERLAAKSTVNISFEGEVSPDQVDDYYQSAGVFVLPSIEGEGTPNVVLEAMSWGIPVVATDSGGIPSIIEDEVNGYIVPMRDPGELKDKIKEVLHGDKSEAMGELAREYVKNHYSWSSQIRQLEKLYRSIQKESL